MQMTEPKILRFDDAHTEDNDLRKEAIKALWQLRGRGFECALFEENFPGRQNEEHVALDDPEYPNRWKEIGGAHEKDIQRDCGMSGMTLIIDKGDLNEEAIALVIEILERNEM